MLHEFAILHDEIHITEPIGYFEFLQLESSALLVLTDSGGVQEEACILGVPCLTLRENTERPETVDVGANILVGTDSDQIIQGVQQMINLEQSWNNPYGDGTAGRIIVTICAGIPKNHHS
jgi:UDP-N-acetylglucosamine 2-epimerase (non-hydrolysing)